MRPPLRAAAARVGLLVGLLAAGDALAHGGEPTITGLRFPVAGEVWAITDNQGIYAETGGETAWLCEDAVAPAAGVLDVATLDPAGQRWLLLTEEGFFSSDDGGCTYAAPSADLAAEQISALSAHPDRPGEAVVVTATFGAENDAWRTTDGGATWTPAGLAFRGRFVALRRSEADPDRLYALHDRAGFTSADGGRTWAQFALGDPPALPSAVRLLAAPRGGPGRLWISIEELPGSAIWTTDDAGESWRRALGVDDFEMALAFDRAGVEALLVTGFDGARRTTDGGVRWREEELPVERLQRIARQPGTDRLWGSTGLFFGGPWALGYSDDMGRTWTPALARFEDVDRRWSCPAQSPATRCCSTLCPGQPPEGMCAGQREDDGTACTTPPGPPLDPLPGDMGAPDATSGAMPDAMPSDMADGMANMGPDGMGDGMTDAGRLADALAEPDALAAPDLAGDMAPDARRPPDADPRRDAFAPGDVGDPRDQGRIAPDITVVPANPPTDDGCRAQPGQEAPWPLPVALLLAALRRRGRQ